MYENYEKTLEIIRRHNKTPEFKEQHRKSEEKRRKNGKLSDWQRKNKSKIKTYQDNRMNKNHIITNAEWEACKKYFTHRCAYCGLVIENHWIQLKEKTQLGDFHKEHVDDDGNNDLSNCVPSCKSCNSSKHKFELSDWYPCQEFYTKERHDKILTWINEDYKKFLSY